MTHPFTVLPSKPGAGLPSSAAISSRAGVSAQPGAAAAKMKVVTTFTVLADMARNVAGDAAEVVSVTKPGAEIHGYQPTPRDIVGAHDADLILWNGLNLELWFEQFLAHLGDVPSATLSDGVRPIAIAAGDYEGMANPHAWMGLEGAEIYVDNIRDALIEHASSNPAPVTPERFVRSEPARSTRLILAEISRR